MVAEDERGADMSETETETETEDDEPETDEEAHSRFVAGVVDGEHVWGLSTEDGFLACESDEGEERAVLPFWSDAEEAQTAQSGVEGSAVDSIGLSDFLFRWLPGMDDDDVLVGTNWTADLEGKEVEPLALQDEILDAMSDELRTSYLDRLAKDIQEAKEGSLEPADPA
jgi:hypothetical protein